MPEQLKTIGIVFICIMSVFAGFCFLMTDRTDTNKRIPGIIALIFVVITAIMLMTIK